MKVKSFGSGRDDARFDPRRGRLYAPPAMPRRMDTIVGLAASAALILLGACASPIETRRQLTLRQSIVDSTRRELESAKEHPQTRRLEQPDPKLDFDEQRKRTLDQLGGPPAYEGLDPALGPDLLGQDTQTVAINLQRVIRSAVEHNLDAQIARIDSAVNQTQIVAAEAAFDWTLLTNINVSRTEEPTAAPVVQGIQVGSAINKSRSYGFETGIRKPLTSGGQVEITQTLDIFNNQSPGTDLIPDPGRTSLLEITLDQPLLRGFGSDVNLAEVRLARNLDRRGVQQLRQRLIDVATSAEQAYWALEAAHKRLLIRQRLLNLGVKTRDVLKGRAGFDVRPAEISDAVARVESRRADVIRATNDLRKRSDELKAIINDPRLTVGDETVLIPVDEPVTDPVEFSLIDAITTALSKRPAIQQAVLAIDDASIRERVASNARLPLLDLQFQTQFTGLDSDTLDSLDQTGDAEFVNFILNLAFEQPIGNRAAEADFRRRRLERLRSVVDYRSTVRDTIVQIKGALRDVTTNHRLIEQTRTARLAAAENLRTLRAEEEMRGLTPEFLDLKFTRQDALAAAQVEEIQALTDYNTAIADLHQATGTALSQNGIRFMVPQIQPDRPFAEEGDPHVAADPSVD